MAKVERFVFVVFSMCFMSRIQRSEQVRSPYIHYQNFEDYLSTLDQGLQELITSPESLEADEFQGSGQPEREFSLEYDQTTTTPRPHYYWGAGFTKTKDDSCCMLGQLAGDKGYHCYVKFYAARIMMRNRNRVHNRKMAFYGREKVPNYGDKVMRTFEKCIAGKGTIFHKCCYFADMERKTRIHYSNMQRLSKNKKHKKTETTESTPPTRAKVVALLDAEEQ